MPHESVAETIRQAALESFSESDTSEMRAAAGRAIPRLLAAWRIDAARSAAILDMEPGEFEMFATNPESVPLTPDQLVRCSALLGIYTNLRTLFAKPLDTLWMTKPNAASLFEGKSPVDSAIAGGTTRLIETRRYLEAVAEGY